MDNYLFARLFKQHLKPSDNVRYAFVYLGDAHRLSLDKKLAKLKTFRRVKFIGHEKFHLSNYKQCNDISSLPFPLFGERKDFPVTTKKNNEKQPKAAGSCLLEQLF
jgi:hypothetical protein